MTREEIRRRFKDWVVRLNDLQKAERQRKIFRPNDGVEGVRIALTILSIVTSLEELKKRCSHPKMICMRIFPGSESKLEWCADCGKVSKKSREAWSGGI